MINEDHALPLPTAAQRGPAPERSARPAAAPGRSGARRFAVPIGIAVAIVLIAQLAWSLVRSYGVDSLPPVAGQVRAALAPPLAASPAGRPRSLVLMINDGGGLNHYAAARIHLVGADGQLAIDRMPVVGLMTTHSANRIVTDSAAAATAMATGVKTNNGHVGVDASGNSLRSFLDDARAAGKATGVVVTAPITDATPASFYAHTRDRDLEQDVAEQLLGAQIDVALGAGYPAFVPEARGGTRADDRDLIAEARQQGYLFARTRQDLLTQAAGAGRLLGLFRARDLAAGGAGPSLAEMVELTLQRLSRNPAGFVLMVESSLVDDRSHERDLAATMAEMQAFDRAVQVALGFAQQSQDTLVIVTSDHETGGLAIEDSPIASEAALNVAWRASPDEGRHTGAPVAVFGYGPGASHFGGSFDNTAIATKVRALLY